MVAFSGRTRVSPSGVAPADYDIPSSAACKPFDELRDDGTEMAPTLPTELTDGVGERDGPAPRRADGDGGASPSAPDHEADGMRETMLRGARAADGGRERGGRCASRGARPRRALAGRRDRDGKEGRAF
jgi:hypothetical protein